MILFDRTALIELALGSGVSVLFYCSRLSIRQVSYVCLRQLWQLFAFISFPPSFPSRLARNQTQFNSQMDTVLPTHKGIQDTMRAEDPEEDAPCGDRRVHWRRYVELPADILNCPAADDEATLLLFPKFVQPQELPLAEFMKKMNENNVSRVIFLTPGSAYMVIRYKVFFG